QRPLSSSSFYLVADQQLTHAKALDQLPRVLLYPTSSQILATASRLWRPRSQALARNDIYG
ncbi:MAG: hypothetical protein ACR2NM_03680, partial [Bythopirellula sp.]